MGRTKQFGENSPWYVVFYDDHRKIRKDRNELAHSYEESYKEEKKIYTEETRLCSWFKSRGN